MKLIIKSLLFVFCLLCLHKLNAQQKTTTPSKDDKLEALKMASGGACNCIDSFEYVSGTTKNEVNKIISECIDNYVTVYEMHLQLAPILNAEKKEIENAVNKELKKGKLKEGENINYKSKKGNNINVYVSEKGSAQYKEYYNDLERYMRENCEVLIKLMASNEEHTSNSLSKNPTALKHYSDGVSLLNKQDYKAALSHFINAVKVDTQFAFAWDNMGICYRKIGEIDKAIDAYKMSLFVDPDGVTPIQNLAVAYIYKEDFKQAEVVYEKFVKLYPNNAEGYYGLANLQLTATNEIEKGLNNACKAYVIYTKEKSPYRTDAEQLIGMAYDVFLKEKKVNKFKEILKQNGIDFGDE